MSRPLGTFKLLLGTSPRVPADLADHACLQHKFPSTGKFESWPLRMPEGEAEPDLLASMV